MIEQNLPLTTEMRLRDKAGDEATVQDLPVSVMQALYHEITGRTETLERTFSADYIFRQNDIIQVVYRLLQATQQYNVTGADAQFTVKFTSGEKQTFSSFEKFKQMDTTKATVATECLVSISFLLATPGVGKYQNYRINILLRSVARDAQSSIVWGLHGYREESCKIDIEYVDFVVAETLASVFENWLQTVDKASIAKAPNWFTQIEDGLDAASAAIGFSATLAISFGISSLTFSPIFETRIGLVGFLFASLCLATIAATSLFIFCRSFVYQMWPRGKFPFLLMNRSGNPGGYLV
jgi:hypothetical protein